MKIPRRPVIAATFLAAVALSPLGLAIDGRRDPAFRPQFRTPVTAQFVTANADGTFLLGGEFNQVLGEPRRPVARLRADGTLEPSFTPNFPRKAYSSVQQSDGRVVCLEYLGFSSRVYRLTAGGAPDGTFAEAPCASQRLYLAAGDRLLVERSTPTGFAMFRLRPDGSDDPSFAVGDGSNNHGFLYGARPMPDGSSWVWGGFSQYNGVNANRIARLLPDGSVDASFRCQLPENLFPGSVEPAGDGGILVTSYESAEVPVPALVRLTADGTVAAVYPQTASFSDILRAWLARPGGTRTVRVPKLGPGFSEINPGISRAVVITDLRPDGSVERVTSYPVSDEMIVNLLAVTAEGAAIFEETNVYYPTTYFPPGRHRLLRLDPGATAPAVLAIQPAMTTEKRLSGIAGAADGSALAWGTFQDVDGSPTPAGAAVLRADGRWDVAAVSGLAAWTGSLDRVVALPSGGWVVGGIFRASDNSTPVGLLRLDADGRVNPAWLAAVRVAQEVTPYPLGPLAADPQGRVLVAGQASSGARNTLYRLRPDGTLDSSFQSGLPAEAAEPSQVTVLADGRLDVVGINGPNFSGFHLVRLLPDGRLDPSFDRTNSLISGGTASAPDGSVLISQAGRFMVFPQGERPLSYELKVIRLLADGSVDPSYQTRGKLSQDTAGVRWLRDGRSLVSGLFVEIAERSRLGLARLGLDGSLDASFRPELPAGPDGAGVSALVERADGSLLAAPVAGPDPLVRLLVDPLPTVPGRGRGQLVNVSARGRVEGGDRAMIAGFVVADGPRRVVVRALGPSLDAAGVPGALGNPTLEILSGGTSLASNDDWANGASAAELSTAGLAPTNAREAAVALTLPPGAFTAVVRGAGATAGVALVEVYVLDAPDYSSPPPPANAPRTVNLSVRAFVGASDSVLIGGFAIRGGSARVALRALGPTLATAGVPGTLADPYLTVIRQADGRSIYRGNSWRSQFHGLGNTQPLVLPTPTDAEVGIVLDLPEGDYTALVSGVDAMTGIGMFEIYELPGNVLP